MTNRECNIEAISFSEKTKNPEIKENPQKKSTFKNMLDLIRQKKTKSNNSLKFMLSQGTPSDTRKFSNDTSSSSDPSSHSKSELEPLFISPKSLDFESVISGSTTEKEISLRNSSNQKLSLKISIFGDFKLKNYTQNPVRIEIEAGKRLKLLVAPHHFYKKSLSLIGKVRIEPDKSKTDKVTVINDSFVEISGFPKFPSIHCPKLLYDNFYKQGTDYIISDIIRISLQKNKKQDVFIPFTVKGNSDIRIRPEIYPETDFTVLVEGLKWQNFTYERANLVKIELHPKFRSEIRKFFLLFHVEGSKIIFHFPILIYVH